MTFRDELPGCMIGPSEPCNAFTRLQEELARERVPAADLPSLWDAIVKHTTGDLFWIRQILLSELTKETGYRKAT